MIWPLGFWIFFNFFPYRVNIFKFFFSSFEKKKSELRKNFGYSFDVKIYDLSIYEVSRPIRARQTRFLAR